MKDSIGLPFTLFRAIDALDYANAGVMTNDAAPDATTLAGMAALMDAGMLDGARVSLLFSRPGLSLTYVWFKSGYALPRHSHSADCAYFIIAGSLRMGEEELGPGDGFFIGTDVPYAYTPGANGVEVLEIRTSNQFDFKALVGNATWYDNAAERTRAAHDRWQVETAPPSGMIVGSN
ncbi:MAG: cupin domain-containing protein [Sphingomonadales bacterium]|nr:cupin domain-containing protein [Sphingomonadales bacterium]